MNKTGTVCHKRSSVATDGIPKQPTTGQIDYGEIAINYADGNERLFIKNSSNEIIDFKSGEYIDDALSNHEVYYIIKRQASLIRVRFFIANNKF